MKRQVVVRLTEHQALRCEKLGECLWPTEKLSIDEISRRLLPIFSETDSANGGSDRLIDAVIVLRTARKRFNAHASPDGCNRLLLPQVDQTIRLLGLLSEIHRCSAHLS